jgi:cell division septal protein FtsQ
MDISIPIGGKSMSEYKNKKNLRHRKKKQLWPMILLFAGGILLVVGAVSALNKPAQPKAAIEVNGTPSLKVDKERVDLGNVKLGQTVEVKFQVMNVGDQTLRLTKAPYVEVVEGC